jgi:hypothetical protein
MPLTLPVIGAIFAMALVQLIPAKLGTATTYSDEERRRVAPTP